MTAFKNMKIKNKVTLGFASLIVVAAIVVILSFNSLRIVSDDYSHLLTYANERLQTTLRIPTEIANLRRLATTIVFRTGQVVIISGLESDVNLTLDRLFAHTEDIRANILDDTRLDPVTRAEYLQMLTDLDDLFNYYHTNIITPMLVATMNHDMHSAMSYELAGAPVFAAIEELYVALYESSHSFLDDTVDSLTSLASTRRTLMFIFAFISLGVGILAAVLIIHSIAKPLKQIISVFEDVSKGNFNVNMPIETTDEMGMLAQDARRLIDTTRMMVDDLSKAHYEYMKLGNMHYTINDSKYQNSFKDAIMLVNNILIQNTKDIVSVGTTLNQISEGDFGVNVIVEDWPGEWAILPNALNVLNSNLKGVSNEISDMIEAAAVKGDLNFQINVDNYKGDWQTIMKGLNNVALAVNLPITEIRDAMGKLSQGEFTDAQVTGDYKGDFLKIRNAVNDMINNLNSYLGEVTEILAAMSDGDLTRRIQREFVGNFDKLKQPINNISENLNKTVVEISIAAEQVLSGAKQISTSAMDLANGAQEQASSIEELNATINMISQQTIQNAHDASEANALSSKSTINAQEGNEAMGQMLMAITQMKESSNNISKIIKVIQDIAFQTNLLALNAAVEAARAGEHGKGFAVVAEEVRSLAARSQQSAVETTTLIEDSINRVESGSNIAESTSQSLDTIVQSVADVSTLIDSISTASKEQSEAIEQISGGLEQISSVVQNNSAVSEETAAASEELNSQAELLRQLVSYFKLK
ncbi:MAG: methyl-accepting chemotaxis protein [Defluviitaleaceae bacterium]|nr:methyl-accepting chemotaxis protein [Defluviitaleaceae bacterium]